MLKHGRAWDFAVSCLTEKREARHRLLNPYSGCWICYLLHHLGSWKPSRYIHQMLYYDNFIWVYKSNRIPTKLVYVLGNSFLRRSMSFRWDFKPRSHISVLYTGRGSSLSASLSLVRPFTSACYIFFQIGSISRLRQKKNLC